MNNAGLLISDTAVTSMPIPPKILVLDSGAGCLSIAKEISQLISHADITCFADIAVFPYGQLRDAVLVARQVTLMNYLAPLVKPDLVVLACNTVSTVALDALRNKFKVPFIGVVPAIKPAVKLTRSGAIGVLATPATVQRPYTQQLISEFAGEVEVCLHGSQKLVSLAEQYVASENPTLSTLQEEINLLLKQSASIDVIVLACTHFPLLKPLISQLHAFHAIQWVDSGQAIAQRAQYWLSELGLPQTGEHAKRIEFRFSKTKAPQTSHTKAYGEYAEKHFKGARHRNIQTFIDSV